VRVRTLTDSDLDVDLLERQGATHLLERRMDVDLLEIPMGASTSRSASGALHRGSVVLLVAL
jgi:hypothetical protein